MQHKIYVYINYCIFNNNKSSNHKFFSTSLLFRFLFQFPTFPLVFFPFCSKYLFNLLKSSNFIFLNRIKIIRQLFLPVKIFEQTYELSLSVGYCHSSVPIRLRHFECFAIRCLCQPFSLLFSAFFVSLNNCFDISVIK